MYKSIILIFLFFSFNLLGQDQNEIDSLISITQSSEDKKEQIDAYNELAKKYIFTDSAKAVGYATNAIQLSDEINYHEGIVDAYNMIGYVMSTHDHYQESKIYFTSSLKISDSLNYKPGKMQSYYGLGNLYNEMGDYDNALKSQLQSLELMIEKGDSLNISSGYYGIGSTYYYKQDYDKALEYFERALEIRITLNTKKGVSDIYNTLALVASAKNDSIQAETYFQDAIKHAKKNKNIDHQYVAYLNYGNFLLNKLNLTKAIEIYHKAINCIMVLNRPNDLANLYFGLGSSFNKISKYDSSLYYINAAINIYKNSDNILNLANSLELKSIILQAKGDLINALNSQLRSTELYKSINNVGMYDAKNTLASIYYIQEKYDRCYDIYYDLINHYQSTNNQGRLSQIYGNIANTFRRTRQYDSAKLYYKNAIGISEKLKINDNLIHQYTGFGRYYYLIGDFEDSRKYLLKALEKAKNFEDRFNISKASIYLGELEYKLDNTTKALSLLYSGLSLAEEIQEIEVARDGWKILAQIEKEEGNYQKAFEAMSAYHILYDSLNGMQSRNQLNELEIQFETKSKEQAIKNLEQQASIQSLQLEQSKLYLTISAIAIFSLALVGLVIYLYNRQKRYALEQKAHNIEQTLLRTQMNPHFIFNALTAIQDYNNIGDPKNANLYLVKFSKLMRQVLDNSRSEFISLEQEINMLENYLSLQQLRPDCNFEYTINIDEEIFIEEVSIPPMFAQPFVENAIEHGLSGVKANAKIDINISLKDDYLHLSILDNGKGLINSESIKRDGHKSHAMNITKERIDIYRKMINKNISFQIQDNSPGTKVIFNLPYQYI